MINLYIEDNGNGHYDLPPVFSFDYEKAHLRTNLVNQFARYFSPTDTTCYIPNTKETDVKFDNATYRYNVTATKPDHYFVLIHMVDFFRFGFDRTPTGNVLKPEVEFSPPEDILEDLLSGRAQLVFMFANEMFFDIPFAQIERTMMNKGLAPERAWFLTGNKNFKLHYFNETAFKVIYFNQHNRQTVSMTDIGNYNDDPDAFENNERDKLLAKIDAIDANTSDAVVLCNARRRKPTRVAFIYLLLKAGLDKHVHISFSTNVDVANQSTYILKPEEFKDTVLMKSYTHGYVDSIVDEIIGDRDTYIRMLEAVLKPEIHRYINLKSLSDMIDTRDPEFLKVLLAKDKSVSADFSNPALSIQWMDESDTRAKAQPMVISLIQETAQVRGASSQYPHGHWLISEKAYQPFDYFMLPIMVGLPLEIAQLRSEGFDVYDDFIDHSYDLIDNDADRFNAIVAEVSRLMSDIPALKEFYMRNADRILKNRMHRYTIYNTHFLNLEFDRMLQENE